MSKLKELVTPDLMFAGRNNAIFTHFGSKVDSLCRMHLDYNNGLSPEEKQMLVEPIEERKKLVDETFGIQRDEWKVEELIDIRNALISDRIGEIDAKWYATFSTPLNLPRAELDGQPAGLSGELQLGVAIDLLRKKEL